VLYIFLVISAVSCARCDLFDCVGGAINRRSELLAAHNVRRTSGAPHRPTTHTCRSARSHGSAHDVMCAGLINSAQQQQQQQQFCLNVSDADLKTQSQVGCTSHHSVVRNTFTYCWTAARS